MAGGAPVYEHVLLLGLSLYLSSVAHVALGFNMGVTCTVAQCMAHAFLFLVLLCGQMLRWRSASRPWLHIRRHWATHFWPAAALSAAACAQHLVHPHAAALHQATMSTLHSMDWLVAGAYLLLAHMRNGAHRGDKQTDGYEFTSMLMLSTSCVCSMCWAQAFDQSYVVNMWHAAVAFPVMALAKAAQIIMMWRIGAKRQDGADAPADVMVVSLIVAIALFAPSVYLSSDTIDPSMLGNVFTTWAYNERLQLFGALSWLAAGAYFRLTLQAAVAPAHYVMLRQGVYYAATFGLLIVHGGGSWRRLHVTDVAMRITAGLMLALYWRTARRAKSPASE